jgi:hypothetical protein
LVLGLLIASLLLGCASITAKKTEDGLKTYPKAKLPALLILRDTCPESKPQLAVESPALLAPLALAFVQVVGPVIIEKAVELTADFLESRANALSASSSASVNGTLYSTQGQVVRVANACLIFARGRMGPADKITVADEERYWTRTKLRDRHRDLGLISPPEVYLELAIEYETIKLAENRDFATSLGLRPVFLDYRKSGAERNPDDAKHLVLDVGFESRALTDKSDKDSTFLKTTLDFGDVKIGQTLTYAELRHLSPKMFRLPPAQRVKISPGPSGESSAKEQEVTDLISISVSGSLLETQDGGDLERAIAKATRENKKKLSDPAVKFLEDLVKKVVGDQEKSGQQKPGEKKPGGGS